MKSSAILAPLLLASLASAADFFKVKTIYEDVEFFLQQDPESSSLQLTTGTEEGDEFEFNEFFNLVLSEDPTKVVSSDDEGILKIVDHGGEDVYPHWTHTEGCCISLPQALFACALQEDHEGPFVLTTNAEGLPNVDVHNCFPVGELSIVADEEAAEPSGSAEVPSTVIETSTEFTISTETVCESDSSCEPLTTIRSTTISTYCPSSTTAGAGATTVVVTVCVEETICETYESVVKDTDTTAVKPTKAPVAPGGGAAPPAAPAAPEEDTTTTVIENIYVTHTPVPKELINNANGMKSQAIGALAAAVVVLLSFFA